MSTTVKAARQAYDDAHTTVTDWEAKAAQARAETAEIEANSGALILADPAAADDLALKVHAATLRAHSYDGAATTAREQLEDARRALLEAHAVDYDKQAAKTRKQLEEHQSKVRALLEQLVELDGNEYVDGLTHHNALTEGRDLYTDRQPPRSVTYELQRAALHATNKAAYIRCYIATGKRASNITQLRTFGGQGTGMVGLWGVMGDTPPIVDEVAVLTAPAAQAEAPDQDTDDEFDPVEDADILHLIGNKR